MASEIGTPALLLFACVVAGFGLTYLSGLDLIFEERLFFGTVIGAMGVSLAGFMTASLLGFSATSAWLGAAIALAVSAAGWFRGRREVLPNLRDVTDRWVRKPTVPGHPWPLLLVAVVAGIYVYKLFANAYRLLPDGLYAGTGGTWADWAAHLSYAGSFAYGANFPPQLPLDQGHHLPYPFMIDFLAASLVPLGASLPTSLVLSSALLAFAFAPVMYLAGMRLTGSRPVAALAPFTLHAERRPELQLLLRRPPERGPGGARPPAAGVLGDHGGQLSVAHAAHRQHASPTLDPLRLRDRADRPVPPLHGRRTAGLADFPLRRRGHRPVARVPRPRLRHLRRARRLLVRDASPAGVDSSFVPALALGIPVVLWLLPESGAPIRVQLGWLAMTGGHNDNVAWFWLKNLGLFIPLLLIAQFARGLLPTRWLRCTSPRRLAAGSGSWCPTSWLFHPWDWDNQKFFVYWAMLGSFLVAAVVVRVARARLTRGGGGGGDGARPLPGGRSRRRPQHRFHGLLDPVHRQRRP